MRWSRKGERGSSKTSGIWFHPVPSCSSRIQREGSLTADTDRWLPPAQHVPLTLPFRCQSTASPRFSILTLRAAENWIFFITTVSQQKQLINSPSFSGLPPPQHPTSLQGIHISEHTTHMGVQARHDQYSPQTLHSPGTSLTAQA